MRLIHVLDNIARKDDIVKNPDGKFFAVQEEPTNVVVLVANASGNYEFLYISEIRKARLKMFLKWWQERIDSFNNNPIVKDLLTNGNKK